MNMNTDKINELKKALSLNPDDGAIWYELALEHERYGELEETIKTLIEARRHGFDNGRVSESILRILIDLGRYSEASDEVSLLEKTNFSLDKLLLYKARIALYGRRYAEAEKLLTRAVKGAHKKGEAVFELGLLKEMRGEVPEAVKCFTSSLEEGYKSDESARHLANILRENNRAEDAGRIIKPYALKDTASPELISEYARSLFVSGDIHSAIENFSRAAESASGSDSASYYFEAGTLLKESGKMPKAIEYLQKARGIDPDIDNLTDHLVTAYLAENRLSDAEKILLPLIKSKEARAADYISFSYILRNQDNKSAAIELLKEASERFSKDESVFCELGKLCEEERLFAAAAKAFEKMGTILDKKGSSRLFADKSLARIYAQESRWDKVEKILKDIGKSRLDAEDYAYLSRVYSIMQREDEADDAAEKAAEYKTKDNYIFARASESRLLKGDDAGARRLFTEVISRRGSDIHFDNKSMAQKSILDAAPTLESRPQNLAVHLTSRCNLRCVMCHHHKMKAWDLPGRVTEEIIELLPYLESISWLGGEAFFHKDFKKLFTEAQKYLEMHQELVTNGLMIDEKWADLLASSNLELEFSIDSVNAENYARIRRGGVFEELLRRIALVNLARDARGVDCRLRTGMHFVVMRTNYKEIPYLADFAAQLRMSSLKLYSITGDYDGYNITGEDTDILKEIKLSVENLRESAWKNNLNFQNFMNVMIPDVEKDMSGKVETSTAAPVSKKKRCLAPWKSMIIDMGGDVYPFCQCSQPAGNIEKDRLMDIWNSDIMMKYREGFLEGGVPEFCPPECPNLHRIDRLW